MFGVLFVLLFVIVAIAEGIGPPSIPSGAIAVIEGMPADAAAPFDKPAEDCNGKKVTQDLGVVTEDEFNCAFKQLAAGSGLKALPKPGDEQYDALREGAISEPDRKHLAAGAGGRRRRRSDCRGSQRRRRKTDQEKL